MIELKNVVKIYNKGSASAVTALNGISLKVEDGEFVSIMGPSGSGKSTLLHILGCMDTMTEGEYLLDGKLIDKKKPEQLHHIRGSKISFVFQQFALMNTYTVYENVELPLLAQNVRKKERKRMVHEQLKRLGIDELSKKLPGKISGGQQQRTAIARALASGAPIILADEPTGALDQKTSGEVLDLLKEINEEGKTIIIVTHDPNVAARTKRCITIVDGMIESDEPVS